MNTNAASKPSSMISGSTRAPLIAGRLPPTQQDLVETMKARAMKRGEK